MHVRLELPVTPPSAIDLLFVIDDSPSTADKQENLARNFPAFLTALAAAPGGVPDLHIGVVTSDLGTLGAGDAFPGPAVGTVGLGGCAGRGKAGNLQTFGAPTSDVFLSDVSDGGTGRLRNYAGELSDVFAQMTTRAGSLGCGFEQPLEAIKQALRPDNAVNQGFLRTDAALGVVIVTDEDDCSLEHSSLLATDATSNANLGPQQSFRCTRFGVTCDLNGQTPDQMNQVGAKSGCHPNDDSAYLTRVSDYGSFLKNLKADPTQVAVAGVVGPSDAFAVELRAPEGMTTIVPALAHSCTYIGADKLPEVADPAVRIQSLLGQFDLRSSQVNICQQDLSQGMKDIAALFERTLGDPCIRESLAVPNECAVTVFAGDTPRPEDRVLPRCTPEDASATNAPCWHLATDPTTCPSVDHLALQIEGRATLPALSHIMASCLAASP